MSFKVTLPRLPKLDVWGDKGYGVQVMPHPDCGVVACITDGSAAAAVVCTGKMDEVAYLPPAATAKKSTDRNLQITADGDKLTKSFDNKDGIHEEQLSGSFHRVDIVNIFPSLSGSPLAAIDINIDQLIDIAKAMGVPKGGTIRLTYGIKEVPIVQHGLSELAEWNRPTREHLLSEMLDVRKDITGFAANNRAVQQITMNYDRDSWRLDCVPYVYYESNVFRNTYAILFSGETDEQVVDKMLAEYDQRQQDRHIAFPKEKLPVLVSNENNSNIGAFMPSSNRMSVQSVQQQIRRVSDYIQALKEHKNALVKKQAEKEQPF